MEEDICSIYKQRAFIRITQLNPQSTKKKNKGDLNTSKETKSKGNTCPQN